MDSRNGMTVDFNPVWTRAHAPWKAGFVTVFSPALISELARKTMANRGTETLAVSFPSSDSALLR